MKNIIKKILLFLFLAIFFLVPVGLTWFISQKELDSYKQGEKLEFREMGYGEGKSVERRNYKCYIEVSGLISSDTIKTVKIDKENFQLGSSLTEGKEIKKGQVLGTYKQAEVVSEYNAVVDSVEYGEGETKEVFLRVIDANELILKAYVDDKTAEELRNYQGKTLKSDGKKQIEVADVSNVVREDGTEVILKGNFAKRHYGEKVEAMKIYTGEEYKGVLSVEKSCVYQEGEDGPYKVRVLDDDGNYIKEIDVELGVEMGKYVGITGSGLSEGMLCDSGYARLYQDSGEEETSSTIANQ